MTTSCGPTVDDHALLDAFTDRGDQAAFADLVRHHAGLVHGVCRRVLGDPHLADDAMQATFLVLARKAASLRREASLAGWLHRAAELCARSLRRELARRRERERTVARDQEAVMSASAAVDADVSAHLDAALAALPAGQRAVVVERVLCGRSEEETGTRLGLTRSAVSVRLARALTALRERLARRGVAVPAATLAALLAAESAPAASPAVIIAAQAALAAPPSPLVLATTEHAMHALFWTLPKLAAAGLARAAGLAAAAIGILHVAAGETPVVVAAAPPEPAPTATLAAAWAGKPLVKIADDARLPCWSPDGRRLAWITIRGQPESEPGEGGWKPGQDPPIHPAALCAVGIADLATGAIASVDLLRNAQPALGLAWLADGGSLLAWDAQRIWRIDGVADGHPVLRDPLLVGADRRIGAVLPAPTGGRWLCICPPSDDIAERLESTLLVFDGAAAAPVELSGRKPLWSPDGATLYFSHLDAVMAWYGRGPGGLRPLFTASYFLTHPFPKAVAPREGFRYEVWPLALFDRPETTWVNNMRIDHAKVGVGSGLQGLAVEVVEVAARARGFGPSHRWWEHTGEVVLWTPQGAKINDAITDRFEAIAQTSELRDGPSIQLLPLDGHGRFLRLENAADVHSRLDMNISSRLRRLLAMTIDGDNGTIALLHNLPLSHPATRIFGSRGAAPVTRVALREAVRYEFVGLAADGATALFTYSGSIPGESADPQRSATGLVWLEPGSGRQRWLELSAEVVPSSMECNVVLAPHSERAALAIATHDAGDGSTRGIASRGRSYSVWFANPSFAQANFPLAAGITGLAARSETTDDHRPVGFQHAPTAPSASTASPQAQDF